MEVHEGQPVRHYGSAVDDARGVLILLHGRGAGADDILSIGRELAIDDLCCFAPEAAGASWFPYSFLVPLQQNEPGVSSAMAVVDGLITEADLSGIDAEHVFLLGFSQGACLVLEYLMRNPARYGGVMALSGGLLGPPGTQWTADGTLDQTPVLIGSSDVDPHVPISRLQETAEAVKNAGGAVDVQLYTGMSHQVTEDEIKRVRQMIVACLA